MSRILPLLAATLVALPSLAQDAETVAAGGDAHPVLSPEAPVEAEPEIDSTALETCVTRIGGETTALLYDPLEIRATDTTAREATLLATKRRSAGILGNITCPGIVSLDHMAAMIPAAERRGLCLVYEGASQSYVGFSSGERDAFLVCKDTAAFCEYFDAAKGIAMTATGLGAGEAGAAATGSEDGLTATALNSGAVILRDRGGFVAGTLGTAGSVGSAAASVATAPLALSAAAISAVAIGGAYYVCK